MRFVQFAISASVLALSTPVFAQEGAPGQGAIGVDDIVVTARKRAESLQDVPLSVTAVNSASIERNNIVKIDQVAQLTPNVQLQPVSVNPTNISAYIRGIGNRAQEPSQDVPIAISIDGVYLTDIAGSLVDVFDVQQVEVLRGPQGTLQGRNSPGGAINITTKRPTGEFGAKFEALYARFDELQLKGIVEAPLVKDKIAVKLSAFRNTGGGYVHNITTGETMGSIRNWGGRLGILLTPDDKFTAYITADFVRDNSLQPNIRSTPYSGSRGPRDPEPATCSITGFCTPIGKYENASNFTTPNSSKNGGLAANINYDAGAVTLTSVTGYRFVNETNNTDVDASPSTILEAHGRHTAIRALSQEFRVASNGTGPLSFVAGVYGIRSKFDLVQPLYLSSALAGLPPPFFTLFPSSARQQVTTSAAVFGQASYKITDKWSISGGARFTHDHKHMISTPAFSPTTFNGSINFHNLSVEAGTEYRFSRAVNSYFRFSQGYRSGGFNGDQADVSAINVYRPEKINSYEVGLKTEFWDRRATANISAFKYDYTDIQITAVDSSPVGSVQRIVNGKGIEIYGVEFEGSLRPTRQLAITAAVGYLHAKYESEVVNLGFGPTNLADIAKDYTPKFTGYLSADYTIPLQDGEMGSVVLNADMNYRSSQYTSPVANLISFQDKYALVNAALTYKAKDDRFSIGVFGKNLTDKYYITTGELTGGALSFQNVGRPRSYGVRASVQF